MMVSFMSKRKKERKWSRSVCLTLCDPMDYSLSGASIHGIFQARILEWVAIPFSRGSSLYIHVSISALQISSSVLVAQTVKNLPAMLKTWVQSPGWEDALEEDMTTHSSIPAWRILMDRGAWWVTVHGVAELDMTEWLSTAHSSIISLDSTYKRYYPIFVFPFLCPLIYWSKSQILCYFFLQ